jgi:hypothetical protein
VSSCDGGASEEANEEGELLLGAMLKHEELAFIKAIGSMELSPVLLRVLRKAMAAAKRKKAISVARSHASAPALVHSVGAGGGVRAPLDLMQSNLGKGNAEELPNQDCVTEPAIRRPAPGHPLEDGPDRQGTTGELAAQSSRKLGSTEGRLAYGTVVARVASLHNPSGPQMSAANSTAPAEPAASTEVANRRMYLGDVSGPMCGMLNGAT